MKLYHCFPRGISDLGASGNARMETGLHILSSIIRFGLLCTPERMRIFPSPLTADVAKRRLLERGDPELMVVQSRFCATLCDRYDLFAARRGQGVWSGSHARLFGPMAIGFDPIRSRQMGFVPTIYYTRRPIAAFAERGMKDFATQMELIQRLKEVRDVLIALAHVEAGLEIEEAFLPGADMLEALDLNLPFEPEVMARLRGMRPRQRREVLRLFETDREIALNLVGAIEVLLSLFQEADSSIDESFLSFFEQREWRIVHQMRIGTKWYCLGERPDFQNPLADDMWDSIRCLRALLECQGERRPEGYYENAWVLSQIDGARPADFIDEVIVPRRYCDEVREMFSQEGLAPEIVPSEDIAAV